jgi:hypothetical protein
LPLGRRNQIAEALTATKTSERAEALMAEDIAFMVDSPLFFVC